LLHRNKSHVVTMKAHFSDPVKSKDTYKNLLDRQEVELMKKDNPLPKPPNSAFGRKNSFEQPDEQETLLADRMAAAMAEGKLDEFIKQEMPDNEYARNLSSMMMGMTGMLSMGGAPLATGPDEQLQQSSGSEQTEQVVPSTAVPTEVPEDVRKAIEGADVKSLMELLRREHSKRTPGSGAVSTEETMTVTSTDTPAIDKDQVDALLQIAKDNSVSVDWLILRAIKVYVQEYQKTGKL
jgi:hypothetical protein